MRIAYHAGIAAGASRALNAAIAALGALLLLLASLGLSPSAAAADPVVTVVRGVEPDGSERLLADVALMWRASSAHGGSWLAVTQMADGRSRLRAVRLGRAEFAVIDAGSFAALRGDYPNLVVLSALMPLTVHVLARMETGPLRAVPGTLVYTGHSRFAAESLAVLARIPASAPSTPSPTFANPPSSGPRLQPTDPLGAIELLRRGLAPDTIVLLAAPLGTQEIAAALKGDPGLRLVNLAPTLAEAVRRDRPWLFTLPIPRGYYPNQGEGVDAPAIHPLLVTLPQLSQDDARRMLECLYSRREQVAAADPLFVAVDRRINSEFAKWAPYHATAAKEFGLTP